MLDAIVIGAGAAGVGAAAVLRAAGIDAYVVLEASDRVGGRVKSFSFGNSTVHEPVILEDGANWVSGAGPPPLWPRRAVNPIFDLALRHSVPMVRVPGSATNMSNWWVADEFGDWTDLNHARRDRANKVKTCIAQMSKISGVDMTAAAGAEACGWRSLTNVDRALEWQLFTGETGLPPQKMLASRYLPDPTYDDFGADDFFVVEQHERGFARLLDAVADGELDGGLQALTDGRLVLNTNVTSISYSCLGGATVRAADGRSWSARHVISTIPLGVLQRRADTLFSPPIPPPQRAAIGRVPMSNYTKIFAQWARPWWDVTVYKWAQGNRGFNGGELGSVRNLAHKSVLPGSNVLLFDLGEPQSSEWERLTDEAARARLVMRLRETHPGTAIDEPVAFHISRHSLDPLSYGAYSAWGDSDSLDHDLAAKPLAARKAPAGGQDVTWAREATMPANASNATCPPRVWLSGEAFCQNYNGFVHGGLLAGRRDARQVLMALGRPLPAMLPGEEKDFGCELTTSRVRRRRGRT